MKSMTTNEMILSELSNIHYALIGTNPRPTIREYFASKAMQALADMAVDPQIVARAAVSQADALIAALKEPA